MPSFDIISEVNMHEVTNGVDQANREISNRFDFKGVNAEFDIKSLNFGAIQITLNQASQEIKIKQGIEQEIAKQISKLIKDSKLKVQASIQGDKVRVTGKKRDDLQETIALLRKQELPLPLQYDNFRD
jgi:uncharacterized protein YajQ (UPF0234 family)